MECTFCGKEIRQGLDSIYVTAKGKMLHFCSSKCDKNMLKLKRSRRKTKWTKSYRNEKEARLKLLGDGVKEDKVRKIEKKIEQEDKKKTEKDLEKPAVPKGDAPQDKKKKNKSKKKGGKKN